MIRLKKIFSGVLVFAGVVTFCFSAAAEQTTTDSTGLQKKLDSLGYSINDLESKVRSTLMFGGSSPVSFSGEARLRLQYHEIDNPARYLAQDKSYLEANWEGNESFVRIGMVARAGRNTVLWTKIGFQNTLPGTWVNKSEYGDSVVAQLGHKDGSPAIIHEDMNAGIALRTVPASFWLKLGGVQWIEASPFTIWKSQPRTFGWEYLPFEVEQPIARYFEYNLAKGEKSGRAAWNKKSFQGINLESINLPGNLYFNLFYGRYQRYDNFEREYIDFSNDIAYSGETTLAKGVGIGNSYQHLLFGKIAANEILGHLTPSLDFAYYHYDDDIYTNSLFKEVFDFDETGKGFFKEPFVTSFDLRGPINDKLSIHGNFALNFVDTTWVNKNYTDSAKKNYVIDLEKKRTPLYSAGYLHLESKYLVPINADIAVIGKGFYSPNSFAAPVDAFFPFGANLLGPGKFIGCGEASPYTQNMAGINLQVVPNLPGYGHMKITYGQHFQLESAEDVIFFPYRLNGQDIFSLFQSSYSRWGGYPVDIGMFTGDKGGQTLYQNRMGDEGFIYNGYRKPRGPMAGGLRTDYLSAYEAIVPYRDSAEADSNYKQVVNRNVYNSSLVYTPGKYVPSDRKFTFNLEFDGSYDISPLFNYPHDFFLGLYAALNGVSSGFKPIAFNDKEKDMMLWGAYLRFEPAIALTNKFYVIGLAGFENWRAQNTYIYFNTTPGINKYIDSSYVAGNLGEDAAKQFQKGKRLFNVPINYMDYAMGIGFDWDMLARVGLHARIKWMKHDDVNFESNSFKTPVISTEIKMWF